MSRSLVYTFAALCLLAVVNAIHIDLPAHGKECFFEDLKQGDKMTVTFQVGEGGNLDIDFWIQDPQDRVLKSVAREQMGTHAIEAAQDGRHTYCFGNQMSSITAKSINFNVHDKQKVEASAKEHIDPIQREIQELADSIYAVKAEQEYIVVRERQHRDTAESTNARVKWWSLGQLALLAAVCFWQVIYLKRFFEVKRVV
ncbi:supernatant protein factor C-terminal domain-containing protein [Syncephalastrum racemosum]|uniref:Supernatant protein factor C-terminal domain-containing protein n=1 Tax=Syncephalastrum racemosum TaxID=13706 RepID=A0A1X2HP29_SYNRA|nr:supernatant protein factor C-terminal domain-containing protein [Syncephalastrum racemosum]